MSKRILPHGTGRAASTKGVQFITAAAAAAVVLSLSPSAEATLRTGPGGRGVTVGESSLIGTVDFSDTFTGTADGSVNPNRPYQAAVQPAPAYIVESTYGKPNQQNFSTGGASTASFSFAADKAGTPGLVNGNTQTPYPGSSGAGSATGFTQTGGGVDYGLNYGLRDNYIVQVDATGSPDRIDITSAPFAGSIFQRNSLTVFFRGQAASDTVNGNNVSLFTSVIDPNTNELVNRDTPLRGQPGYENFSTGLAGNRQWNNYAVRFDRANNQVEIYVNEQSLAVVNLLTFAGGIYANFSGDAVGAGGSPGGGNRIWTDNFQVGSVAPPPVPEPGSLALAGLAGGAMLLRRRRHG